MASRNGSSRRALTRLLVQLLWALPALMLPALMLALLP
tara:strand:- start:422 stop:535 length:114 start_codon:yes stop_codon:yes gene_type:complete